VMFTDGHTWTTLFYMLLMLPLGIIYFTIAVTLLSVSLAFIGSPFVKAFGLNVINMDVNGFSYYGPGWAGTIALCLVGIVLLFATLHLVRGIGHLHGQIAKHLLVPSSSI
jgi:hypothetical protein